MYAHEMPGKVVDSIWTDISPVNSQAQEDTRYSTQKPEALLGRIIRASSNEDDLVLDCFCARAGTGVVTPLNPPVNGGRPEDTSSGEALAPSPSTGRAGVGSSPIEDLHPGDWVLAHDGRPHRVTRTHRRRYRGEMIGLRHTESETILWLTPDHRVLCPRRVQSLS